MSHVIHKYVDNHPVEVVENYFWVLQWVVVGIKLSSVGSGG